MKEKFNIAIISLSTLENCAFKSMLCRLIEPDLLFIESFSSFDEMNSLNDNFNYWILSSDTYLINFNYFHPRRKRTIIVFDKKSCSSEYLNDANVIFNNTDEAQIERLLVGILEDATSELNSSAELSEREKEVLREISKGFTNKEIGVNLNISVNTVITHRKNISAKLGIRTASGLSIYALMNGYT